MAAPRTPRGHRRSQVNFSEMVALVSKTGERLLSLTEFAEMVGQKANTLRKRLYRNNTVRVTMIGGDYMAPASEWSKLLDGPAVASEHQPPPPQQPEQKPLKPSVGGDPYLVKDPLFTRHAKRQVAEAERIEQAAQQLPEMVGTTRQCVWADDIRRSVLEFLIPRLAHHPQADAAIDALIAAMSKQRAARWWIDHRDNIRAALQPLFAEEIKRRGLQ